MRGKADLFQRKLSRWEAKVTKQLVKVGDIQQQVTQLMVQQPQRP